MQTPRVFTVSRRFIQGRPGQRSAVVPMLRMSGHWLSACGFDEGAVVSVRAGEGRLVITIVYRGERPAAQHVVTPSSQRVATKPTHPGRARALPRLLRMRRSLHRIVARRGDGRVGAPASASLA